MTLVIYGKYQLLKNWYLIYRKCIFFTGVRCLLIFALQRHIPKKMCWFNGAPQQHGAKNFPENTTSGQQFFSRFDWLKTKVWNYNSNFSSETFCWRNFWYNMKRDAASISHISPRYNVILTSIPLPFRRCLWLLSPRFFVLSYLLAHL